MLQSGNFGVGARWTIGITDSAEICEVMDRDYVVRLERDNDTEVTTLKIDAKAGATIGEMLPAIGFVVTRWHEYFGESMS